ncbi:glutathione S-transferase [Apiospora phragmitis]|uniref:Glutathione S-transferase n=1 Tax=Apiospora phragmitis TaxID=2905665 RepID=A0ABR1UJX6_9PEZI
MAANQLTLFDLPSQGRCACWSLNPWKTRMNLNFKGVDYKTEWLEYPDIKPRLEKTVGATSAPPTDVPSSTDMQPHSSVKLPEGKTTYTIPTVILPDGSYMEDSLAIAHKLEELYPEPKLAGIETPAFDRLSKDLLPAIMGDLKRVYFSLLPERILNKASYEFWQTTRAEALGLGQRPSELTDADRDDAWQQLEASGKLKQITALLNVNTDKGALFEGKDLTFADFAWAGFLIFWKRIGDAEYEKVLELTGDKARHLLFLEVMQPYIKRESF